MILWVWMWWDSLAKTSMQVESPQQKWPLESILKKKVEELVFQDKVVTNTQRVLIMSCGIQYSYCWIGHEKNCLRGRYRDICSSPFFNMHESWIHHHDVDTQKTNFKKYISSENDVVCTETQWSIEVEQHFILSGLKKARAEYLQYCK